MTDDLSKKKELHDDAKALLEDPAFSQAILTLRKRLFDQLIAAPAEEVFELRAQIKALEGIPKELAILINDFKMAANRVPRRA